MKKVLLGLLFLFVPIIGVSAAPVEITQDMLDEAYATPGTKVNGIEYQSVNVDGDNYDYYYLDEGEYKIGGTLFADVKTDGIDQELVFFEGSSTLDLNNKKVVKGVITADGEGTNLTVNGPGYATILKSSNKANITVDGGMYAMLSCMYGDMYVKDADVSYAYDTDGFYGIDNALALIGNSKITIEDGSFIGDNVVSYPLVFTEEEFIDIIIKGGYFKANNQDQYGLFNGVGDNIRLKLSGGTFEKPYGIFVLIMYAENHTIENRLNEVYGFLAEGYKYSEELVYENYLDYAFIIRNEKLSVVPIEEETTNEETTTEEKKEVKNPKTGDSILIYVVLLLASIFIFTNIKELFN